MKKEIGRKKKLKLEGRSQIKESLMFHTKEFLFILW
jgi:hypothetical protein